MKYLLILALLSLSRPLYCQGNYVNEKVFDCIESISKKADTLAAKGEIEKSMQLRFDSMGLCVEGLSLLGFEFNTIKGTKIKLKDLEGPSILKISASWCAPCISEIPAINKIAEEYEGSIKLIMLFWDDEEALEEMKKDYAPNIELVPSIIKSKDPGHLEIADFKHFMGFPASYYLNKDQKIIYLSRGAVQERAASENFPAISKEEATQRNYERIKMNISKILN